jgi:branched-chain amino acid transport system substrate-binding protein
MNRRTFLSLAIGTAGISWLASCAPKAPEAILVGATLAMTGKFAPIVSPFDKLMAAWAEIVNQEGGLFVKAYNKKIPLQFIIYDDGSDSDKSRQLYRKLIEDDKVHLLLGPYHSSITVGASAVAETAEIPMICIEANSDAIYSRGFKWIVGILDTGRKWSHNYIALMKAKTNARTIAFLAQDNLHTKEVYEGAKEKAEEVGIRSVFEMVVAPELSDFTPILETLAAVKPDIMFLSAFDKFGATFVRQAKAANFSPKALHVIHHGRLFLEQLQEDASLVTGEHHWVTGIKGTGDQEFGELLRRSGITAEEYPEAALRMIAFQALRATVEQSPSLERSQLLATLKQLNIPTLAGTLTFAANGAGSLNPFPTQIQGKKYVPVWPPALALGEYTYPRSLTTL